MEKYNWTVEEIDNQDFFRILELETGDWKAKAKEQSEPMVFIDQLGF